MTLNFIKKTPHERLDCFSCDQVRKRCHLDMVARARPLQSVSSRTMARALLLVTSSLLTWYVDFVVWLIVQMNADRKNVSVCVHECGQFLYSICRVLEQLSVTVTLHSHTKH